VSGQYFPVIYIVDDMLAEVHGYKKAYNVTIAAISGIFKEFKLLMLF